MRHRKKFNHLSRKAGHRIALLRNMASSLLTTEKKRIITTHAKAKALQAFVEPLITKAKDNTTHSRRVVFSRLQNKYAVTELFGPIAAKVGDRPGGYTRVLKLGPRKGDNAEMAMIELVDFSEFAVEKPKKSSRRRRKGGAKKAGGADKAAAEAKAKAEAEAAAAKSKEEEAKASEEEE